MVCRIAVRLSPKAISNNPPGRDRTRADCFLTVTSEDKGLKRIIFTDCETKQFDVNMNDIKIPEKYLED